MMTAKAAQLKQTLCFRSLRLMDKDYLKTNLKSFSDSEVEERGFCKESFFLKNLKKCSSENCLLLPAKENGSGSIHTQSSIRENNKTINKSVRLINSDFSKTSENSQSVVEISAHAANKASSSELKQLKTEREKNSIKNHDGIVPEMSNPYQLSKSSSTSEVVNENILGEPRCLALKKYSGDFNPFLADDSLVFEPDFEDDNFDLNTNINRFKKKIGINRNPQIKDMFLDDEEAAQCEKKNSAPDREEGELSPEIQQAVSDVNKEDYASSKLNSEFFQKINECLLDLDNKCREFYSSSTPEGAMKHLQRTLSNVDSIKRKLTFLISSKNSENEKRRKLREIVEKYYISRSTLAEESGRNSTSRHSRSTLAEESERNSTSRHSRSYRKRSADASGSGRTAQKEHNKEKENSNDFDSRKKDKDLSHSVDEIVKKADETNYEKNEKYYHRKRKSRDKLTQSDLLNRKKVDILEKLGTKKEIQRIKSLFERQMNLITKHVIQEKETSKGHKAEKYRMHHNSQKEIDKNKEPLEKIDLNELQSLEDMEAFLNTLKNRTNDKILSEQFIRNERKKKLLMFSSKRDKDASLELRSKKIIPLTPVLGLDNSKTVLETLPIKESSLAVASNQQKNQISDFSEFKAKEIDLGVVSKDSSFKETPSTNDMLKITGSQTSVHTSSSQLERRKTSEQLKSDTEKRSDGELRKTNSVEDVVALKADKSFNTEKEAQTISSKQPRHKRRNSHNTHDRHQIETVKRKRNDPLGSKHEEPQIDEEMQSIKRKRTSEYLASLKKSTVSDSNLDIENSQSELDLDSKKVMDEASDSLIKDLLSKKIFILDDNNLAMNNQFCLKVINNEVFLKKISSRRKHKRSRRRVKSHDVKKIEENLMDDHYPKEDNTEKQPDMKDAENTSLEDMENFLQELRSKKKVYDDDVKQEPARVNAQCKELKFLAKIRAKRKAKLMACVSDCANATEKEAKFLKSLERREAELSDSSDIESRKQKLMEKMRAEVDAIIFAEKPKMSDDDPLKDVKTFLDLIKEAESVNDESSKQVYVSFSLKRSDVKRLESLTSGKSSSLTEESQKFLNSVRAKMRAKKAPVSNISSLMRKPVD